MLVHKTYQMRAYTSKAGYSRISNVLNVCRELHNTLLAEAKAVYRLTGKSMGRYGRQRHLTTLRAKSQELSDIDSRVERGALRRLDKAFDNFFARIDEHRATLARRIRKKRSPGETGLCPVSHGLSRDNGILVLNCQKLGLAWLRVIVSKSRAFP